MVEMYRESMTTSDTFSRRGGFGKVGLNSLLFPPAITGFSEVAPMAQ